MILYSIGDNQYGQQGNNSKEESIKQLTKIKAFRKKVKNIITGRYGATYIVFEDGTYECCGYNGDCQLGIGHFDNIKQLRQYQNNINIKNIFTSPVSNHAFCISNTNKDMRWMNGDNHLKNNFNKNNN